MLKTIRLLLLMILGIYSPQAHSDNIYPDCQLTVDQYIDIQLKENNLLITNELLKDDERIQILNKLYEAMPTTKKYPSDDLDVYRHVLVHKYDNGMYYYINVVLVIFEDCIIAHKQALPRMMSK